MKQVLFLLLFCAGSGWVRGQALLNTTDHEYSGAASLVARSESVQYGIISNSCANVPSVHISNISLAGYGTRAHSRGKKILGFCLFGTGAFIGTLSFIALGISEHVPTHTIDIELGTLAAGVAIGITGLVLVASDRGPHYKRPYQRWNLITPRKNEMGLAYRL